MNNLTQLYSQELATSISPEMELLLCCARTNLDLTTVERIKVLLQQNIDFTALISLAGRHRVQPLIYQNIIKYLPELIPQSHFLQMQKECRNNSWRNMYLTQELINTIQLLEANGIKAISFKGPVLAASVYGNLSLRQISDLDFLVKEQDFQKTADLFVSQGYKLRINDSGKTILVSGKINVKAHWEIHLLNNNSFNNIDLHQAIVPSHLFYPLSSDYPWQNQELFSLAGNQVLTVTPEANLLILCLNGTKDCWQSLSRICDLAELIRVYPNLDWQKIMENAEKMGLKRLIFLSLYLAKNLLEAKIPDFIWQQVQSDQVVIKLSQQLVSDRLFTESIKPIGMVESTLFCLKTRERWQDQILSFLGLINLSGWMNISSNDRNFLLLPSYLSFLYYLIRPIRILIKYYKDLTRI